MGLAYHVAGFAVRQVLDGVGDALIEVLEVWFDDPGERLPDALSLANDRSWQVLELALQDQSGLLIRLNRLPSRLTSKEKRALADRLSAFLDGRPLILPDGARAEQALVQLRQARERGLLDLPPDQGLIDEAGGLQRYANPLDLLAAAHRTVGAIGDEFDAAGYPTLAAVLAAQPQQSPPLLITAFTWFFQRQVETDPELARGLHFQQLQQEYTSHPTLTLCGCKVATELFLQHSILKTQFLLFRQSDCVI